MATELTNIDAKLNAIAAITNNSTDWASKVYDAMNTALRSNLNSFGSAALKDTGTSSGDIPVLDANGKLDTSILPDSTDNFTDLDDTPNNFTGHGGKAVLVKGNERGLNFGNLSFLKMSDTPAAYTGHHYKTLFVNGLGNSMEFVGGAMRTVWESSSSGGDQLRDSDGSNKQIGISNRVNYKYFSFTFRIKVNGHWVHTNSEIALSEIDDTTTGLQNRVQDNNVSYLFFEDLGNSDVYLRIAKSSSYFEFNNADAYLLRIRGGN